MLFVGITESEPCWGNIALTLKFYCFIPVFVHRLFLQILELKKFYSEQSKTFLNFFSNRVKAKAYGKRWFTTSLSSASLKYFVGLFCYKNTHPPPPPYTHTFLCLVFVYTNHTDTEACRTTLIICPFKLFAQNFSQHKCFVYLIFLFCMHAVDI